MFQTKNDRDFENLLLQSEKPVGQLNLVLAKTPNSFQRQLELMTGTFLMNLFVGLVVDVFCGFALEVYHFFKSKHNISLVGYDWDPKLEIFVQKPTGLFDRISCAAGLKEVGCYQYKGISVPFSVFKTAKLMSIKATLFHFLYQSDIESDRDAVGENYGPCINSLSPDKESLLFKLTDTLVRGYNHIMSIDGAPIFVNRLTNLLSVLLTNIAGFGLLIFVVKFALELISNLARV